MFAKQEKADIVISQEIFHQNPRHFHFGHFESFSIICIKILPIILTCSKAIILKHNHRMLIKTVSSLTHLTKRSTLRPRHGFRFWRQCHTKTVKQGVGKGAKISLWLIGISEFLDQEHFKTALELPNNP